LSHTEFPSSVESFSSLKLVRRACGHGMWFVFFTLKGNNTMWPLLWREETKAKKETKATKETKAMKATFVDEEMRDQVLQRVGEEALHRLETTEIPTWVAAERRAQHRACEAERVANRTNEQRQKDKEQHRACEAERVANRTNEQRQKDKEQHRACEAERVANLPNEQRQKDKEQHRACEAERVANVATVLPPKPVS
jgi:alpha-galactosidase/6-phospho-beta-glucosidase family protein